MTSLHSNIYPFEILFMHIFSFYNAISVNLSYSLVQNICKTINCLLENEYNPKKIFIFFLVQKNIPTIHWSKTSLNLGIILVDVYFRGNGYYLELPIKRMRLSFIFYSRLIWIFVFYTFRANDDCVQLWCFNPGVSQWLADNYIQVRPFGNWVQPVFIYNWIQLSVPDISVKLWHNSAVILTLYLPLAT